MGFIAGVGPHWFIGGGVGSDAIDQGPNLVTIPSSMAVWNTLLYLHAFNWEDSKLLVANAIVKRNSHKHKTS